MLEEALDDDQLLMNWGDLDVALPVDSLHSGVREEVQMPASLLCLAVHATNKQETSSCSVVKVVGFFFFHFYFLRPIQIAVRNEWAVLVKDVWPIDASKY